MLNLTELFKIFLYVYYYIIYILFVKFYLLCLYIFSFLISLSILNPQNVLAGKKIQHRSHCLCSSSLAG